MADKHRIEDKMTRKMIKKGFLNVIGGKIGSNMPSQCLSESSSLEDLDEFDKITSSKLKANYFPTQEKSSTSPLKLSKPKKEVISTDKKCKKKSRKSKTKSNNQSNNLGPRFLINPRLPKLDNFFPKAVVDKFSTSKEIIFLKEVDPELRNASSVESLVGEFSTRSADRVLYHLIPVAPSELGRRYENEIVPDIKRLDFNFLGKVRKPTHRINGLYSDYVEEIITKSEHTELDRTQSLGYTSNKTYAISETYISNKIHFNYFPDDEYADSYYDSCADLDSFEELQKTANNIILNPNNYHKKSKPLQNSNIARPPPYIGNWNIPRKSPFIDPKGKYTLKQPTVLKHVCH